MVQSRKRMNRKQKRGGQTYQECYDGCDPYGYNPGFDDCLESMGCDTIKKKEEAEKKAAKQAEREEAEKQAAKQAEREEAAQRKETERERAAIEGLKRGIERKQAKDAAEAAKTPAPMLTDAAKNPAFSEPIRGGKRSTRKAKKSKKQRKTKGGKKTAKKGKKSCKKKSTRRRH